MAAREVRAQALTDSQARWDAWMFIAQARMLDNFTSAQWEVVDAPAAIHAKLLARLDQGRATARRESATGVLSGVHGPNAADFVAQEALNYEVLDALLPLHEAWCNCELEPTSVYGVRLYREGATLIDHLDVPETHVISSILHIDSKLRAPFPIEIEDASGAYASVSLEPGQMMFYESAKCFHRRSVPMQGDYYGSLFLHYRPKRWTFSRDDIRVAVPPFWADGLGRTDDSARAQEEDAAAAAAAAVLLPGESATLTVELDAASEPPAWPVVLEWLRPGTRERVPVAIATKDDSQQLLQTFVGHEWLVTDAHGAQLAALTIDQRETRVFSAPRLSI